MPITGSTCGIKEVPNGANVWMGPSFTSLFCTKEGGGGRRGFNCGPGIFHDCVCANEKEEI